MYIFLKRISTIALRFDFFRKVYQIKRFECADTKNDIWKNANEGFFSNIIHVR